MLVSSLVKIDKFTVSGHQERSPSYEFIGDPYPQRNAHLIYQEYAINRDLEGRSYNHSYDFMASIPSTCIISRSADMICKVELDRASIRG